MSQSSPIVVLAAGGTGGHIFPAEALAELLLAQGIKPVLITDKRYDNYQGTLHSIPTYRIASASPGKGILTKIRAAFAILKGYFQAQKLLRTLQPQAVVGFGGYPSFPTMLAATHIAPSLKTIIHEQNSVLGRVNKFLAGRVKHIATSFPEVRGIPSAAKNACVLTGNPVRSAIKNLWEKAYFAPQAGGEFRILVTGGSQGASIFSDVVPAALASLPEDVQQRIHISQQCRNQELEKAKTHYANLKVTATLAPFFVDIPERLAEAHLFIGRSGASTVAELAVAGRPSILVPYKFAMDDHQTVNAKALEQVGGGWVIAQDDFTPERLSKLLLELLNASEKLTLAAEHAKKAGIVDATTRLAQLVTGKTL